MSPFDVGFSRGFSLFEFLRTYNMKPFGLKQHLDRLYHGADQIGLKIPKGRIDLANIIHDGITKAKHQDQYVKIYVTGGVSDDGITPGPEPQLFMMFYEASTYPTSFYTEGIKVKTFSVERYLPLTKSTSYFPAVLTLNQAKQEGFNQPLYVTHDGFIREGCTWNFFAIHNSKILTPKKDILFGITRNFVVDIAKENNLPIEETEIHISSIPFFTEAFATSTTIELMPISQINNIVIGKPGPVTTKLKGFFDKKK